MIRQNKDEKRQACSTKKTGLPFLRRHRYHLQPVHLAVEFAADSSAFHNLIQRSVV